MDPLTTAVLDAPGREFTPIHRPMRALSVLVSTLLVAPTSSRALAGAAPIRKSRDDRLDIVAPAAIDASHKLKGYGPERAVDGDERTFWLVPGGQRMEMMSRDKWLILDLGTARKPRALDLLGVVNSFGAARVLLDVGNSPDGPWKRAGCFRAFGSPMRWQRVQLGRDVPTVRYMRLFVRREGHATFQHKVHGVLVHCDNKKLG